MRGPAHNETQVRTTDPDVLQPKLSQQVSPDLESILAILMLLDETSDG